VRTPEELETLLEDAFVLHDPQALAQLFQPGAMLVAGGGPRPPADRPGRRPAVGFRAPVSRWPPTGPPGSRHRPGAGRLRRQRGPPHRQRLVALRYLAPLPGYGNPRAV